MGDDKQNPSDHLKEIENIELAMGFIDENIHVDSLITGQLIREIHRITVDGLEREGDITSGAYRKGPVRIAQSKHLPPSESAVPGYMDELVGFINNQDAPKYDLI